MFFLLKFLFFLVFLFVLGGLIFKAIALLLITFIKRNGSIHHHKTYESHDSNASSGVFGNIYDQKKETSEKKSNEHKRRFKKSQETIIEAEYRVIK